MDSQQPGSGQRIDPEQPLAGIPGQRHRPGCSCPVAGRRFPANPTRPLPTIDPGIYTRAVSTAFGGEWDYDLEWRPEQGFALTPGFLNAVFTAQARVARGLSLDCPALVMLSQKSYLQPRWSENAKAADVALNVQAVAARAVDLGPAVCIRRIGGAFHDIFLSPQGIRDVAYSTMGRWAHDTLDAERRDMWSNLSVSQNVGD